jgi:hypothetical protein
MYRLGRASHPTGIVNTWFWQWLCSGPWFRIPAVVKEDKQRFYMMIRGNRQKRIDPFCKPNRVIFPNKIVKKNAQGVKAYLFCPSQFTIDGNCVKSF